MKHLFVEYNLALKLKEKGFDEECFGRYEHEKLTTFSLTSHSHQVGWIVAPLYQQVIDWLRENHDVHISVSTMAFGYIGKLDNTPNPDSWNIDKRFDSESFKSYYEALTKAIEVALKLIQL